MMVYEYQGSKVSDIYPDDDDYDDENRIEWK